MKNVRHLAAVAPALALVLALVLDPIGAHAQEVALDKWPDERANDLVALQSGARTFVNYCLNCHGASLNRWNRLHEIGLDDKQIKSLLIFGNQRVTDTMTVAMNARDAKDWFGKAPPDLSVIVRARNTVEHAGTDYIYTLLRGFYRDQSTLTGWNNVVYPNISMPNIFWERQGPREANLTRVEYQDVPATDGKGAPRQRLVQTVSQFDATGNAVVTRTELDHGGPSFAYGFKPLDAAAAASVDAQVVDLVAYLNWMSEPTANTRRRIGVWAIAFLVVFIGVGRWLNSVFWRDVM
jgi:ubiquinol-cytochrome c reductase cytochrome c1 subunit